jgi:mannose/fructose/N-acetylgalactosamine-specific phosphotransferase system component IIB
MAPMQPPATQQFAKGGLAAANNQIQQTQIMKVIAHYFKNAGMPVDKAMEGVKKEIANGLQLIPFESSVMGFKKLGEGVAQIHFFTVGTIQDLVNDMEYFYKYLKDKGINTIYDSIPAPITAQMFQKLGAKIKESDNPKYKFMAQI